MSLVSVNEVGMVYHSLAGSQLGRVLFLFVLLLVFQLSVVRRFLWAWAGLEFIGIKREKLLREFN